MDLNRYLLAVQKNDNLYRDTRIVYGLYRHIHMMVFPLKCTLFCMSCFLSYLQLNCQPFQFQYLHWTRMLEGLLLYSTRLDRNLSSYFTSLFSSNTLKTFIYSAACQFQKIRVLKKLLFDSLYS